MISIKLVATLALVLSLAGGSVWAVQWGKIKTLEAQLATCEHERGDAERLVSDLRDAIERQNARVRAAESVSLAMREQGEAARADARVAKEAADQAIARLRREQAATHTCEQVRQSLISEATGHEFR